jgi:hypothetical protein
MTSGSVPHLALPFFSASRPTLLVVVASAAPYFSFQPSDVTFASNLGVVLVAHIAQSLIVEADAAKTGKQNISFLIGSLMSCTIQLSSHK